MMKNWVKSKTKMRRCWQLLQQGRTLSQSEASSSPLSSSPSLTSSSSFGQFFNKCSHMYLFMTDTTQVSITFGTTNENHHHWFNPYFSPNRAECVLCWYFLDVTVCGKIIQQEFSELVKWSIMFHNEKRWGVKMTIDDGRMRWFSYFVTSKINCHLHLLQLSVSEEKVQIVEIFSPLPSYSPGKLHHNTYLS